MSSWIADKEGKERKRLKCILVSFQIGKFQFGKYNFWKVTIFWVQCFNVEIFYREISYRGNFLLWKFQNLKVTVWVVSEVLKIHYSEKFTILEVSNSFKTWNFFNQTLYLPPRNLFLKTVYRLLPKLKKRHLFSRDELFIHFIF